MKVGPVTRMGWHKHYAKIFDKTGRHTAEHLALWYLMLHLAFDHTDGEPSHATPKPRSIGGSLDLRPC